MKKGIICMGLAALIPVSFAANAQQAPGYSYVQASLVGYDLGNADLLGFSLSGSYEFTRQIFGRTTYRNLGDEIGNVDIDYSEWSIGGGFIFYEQGSTNAYAGLEYVTVDLDPGSSNDGDGLAIFAGIRSQLTAQVELNGELHYADIDRGNRTIIKAGVLYNLGNNVSLGADLSSTEGDIGWGIGARYRF